MKIRITKFRVFCVISAVSAALAIVAASDLLMAKYVHVSNELGGEYTVLGYDDPDIDETMGTDSVDSYKFKSGLAIKVADNGYPVYIRVAVVPSWKNSSGEIYGQQPIINRDFSFEYNTADWVRHSDGYYYCKTPVRSGGTSPMLIKEDQKLKQIADSPESGYVLHVEVAAETIQAVGRTAENNGTKAVADAWGVDPGQLS